VGNNGTHALDGSLGTGTAPASVLGVLADFSCFWWQDGGADYRASSAAGGCATRQPAHPPNAGR
jgi:hypothetical protein